MRNDRLRGAAAWALIAAVTLLMLLKGPGDKPRELSYNTFWQMAQDGQIAEVVMQNGADWRVTTVQGEAYTTPDPQAEDGKERLLKMDIKVTDRGEALPGALFLLLGAAGVAALLIRRRGGAAGLQKYAAVQADRHIPDVTFEDVIVSGETMQSMRDLAGFLTKPGPYERLGARRPKGVMLYGPPGTGKTLLARALAGEARTPFFAMSGADFVQVYVGVGASRVRELFRKARKAGGGVIFIDEIDAIGKKRDSGNDEREQTLNALLTEMSGFSGRDNILVLAATNRMDTLDAALLREGRFDRRIEVGLPDREQRLRILQVHARNKPLDDTVSLEELSAQTAMFSGAQLEALLNEAAIRAARRGAEAIGRADTEEALCAVTVGEEKPRRLTGEEKRVTAWHEAGHAVVTRFLLPDTRLTRVTVIPSARGAAGYTMSVPPDRALHTRKELIAMIAQALGGRAAEEILLEKGNVTTGAAGDWKRAKDIAAAMAEEWMMGEEDDPKAARRRILEEGMAAARDCLAAHRALLERLALALMEKETLREEEIGEILGEQSGDAGRE